MADWQNRIVETGMVDPKTLVANPRNYRRHPKGQKAALTGALNELGWIAPVTVNRRSGFTLDGHARVELALSAGVSQVPVQYVDLDPAEEALALATLDPISAMATHDAEALDALLRDVQTSDDALQGLIADIAKDAGLYQDKSDIDAEPQVDRAEELRIKWGVESGQMWQLGEHRLICGDCTDAAVVERVMGGEKAVLMVTDPPYGVEYDPSWRNDAAEKGLISYAASSVGKVENDDRVDWSEAFRLIDAQVVYVWHAGRHASEVQESIESVGYQIVCQIIWAKPVFAISRGDYHWQHEPCWYAVKKGKNHNWQGSRSEATLWEIQRCIPEKSGHGTEKPAECMARPIRNNTATGDVVCDPFLGSGTTLIACEQLGRKCRAIEISPGYVAVAIERWHEATGREPVKTNA